MSAIIETYATLPCDKFPWPLQSVPRYPFPSSVTLLNNQSHCMPQHRLGTLPDIAGAADVHSAMKTGVVRKLRGKKTRRRVQNQGTSSAQRTPSVGPQ